jgi:uncharacterized protein YodC (DUF2158 family)
MMENAKFKIGDKVTFNEHPAANITGVVGAFYLDRTNVLSYRVEWFDHQATLRDKYFTEGELSAVSDKV